MNCKEFSEVADSYLSGELLVETNHGLIRHLESCGHCRKELAKRRELRATLKRAVKESAVIDPQFAARLRSGIGQQNRTSARRSLVPALGFAALLIAALIGFAAYTQLFRHQVADNSATAVSGVEHNDLQELLMDAVGNHNHCGVKFGKNPAQKAVNEGEFIALKESHSERLEFIEKHDCYFMGRKYSHTILRQDGKLISILKAESDEEGDPNKIMSLPVGQLSVAGFEAGKKAVFVISDLSEEENLHVARVISTRI